MERKGLFILVIITTMVFLMTMAQAEEISDEKIIKGYNINQWATQGSEIEKSLEELITEIIGWQEKLNVEGLTDQRLIIGLAGSASEGGKRTENESLAGKRAEQIFHILANKFPEAKINYWSEGTKTNARQVRVEYKIIALAPILIETEPRINTRDIEATVAKVMTETLVKQPSRASFYYGIGFFVIVAFAMLFVLIRAHHKISKIKTLPMESEKIREIANDKFSDKEYKCRFCPAVIQRWNIIRHVTKKCPDSPYLTEKAKKGKSKKIILKTQVGSISFNLLLMVIILAFVFTSCVNRKFIMSEKNVNRLPEIPEIKNYSILWLSPHPVLSSAEPYGVRFDMHLKDGRSFPVVRYMKEDDQDIKWMVIVLNPGPDFLKSEAIISARSGERRYSVDGKDLKGVSGMLKGIYGKDGLRAPKIPKFSWDKIRPLAETEIKIWENVSFGSDKDKLVRGILAEIGKGLDQQEIPGLFNKVMSRVAKITTDDIILAGATNFSSLFAIFGVRAWAIVEALIQKADFSLPYYDTALVNQFEQALTIYELKIKIQALQRQGEKAFDQWQEEMKRYKLQEEKYEKNQEFWLRKKSEFETN